MNWLHWTWELPQTLLGICYYLYLKLCGRLISKHSFKAQTVEVVYEGSYGVSLGKYLFCGNLNYLPNRVLHEYGHSRQSLILGPFYLIVIGIPAYAWNRMKRLGWFKSIDYYSFYTERWADSLGGVER